MKPKLILCLALGLAFGCGGCAPRGFVKVSVIDALTEQPIHKAKVETKYATGMFSLAYTPKAKGFTDTNGIILLKANLSGGQQTTLFGYEGFVGPGVSAKADGYQPASGAISAEQCAVIRNSTHPASVRRPDLILRLSRAASTKQP